MQEVYARQAPMKSLLVAAGANNAIGKDGKLLWHLPNDMKFFKNKTWGMPVVMGRKTFEALNKALPGRRNYVITSQQGYSAGDAEVCTDIPTAIAAAAETNTKEIFIIGGGEIYKQTIDDVDRIYMTRVHGNFEGDTYFPDIDPGSWALTEKQDYPQDDKHAYAYSFETWDKK